MSNTGGPHDSPASPSPLWRTERSTNLNRPSSPAPGDLEKQKQTKWQNTFVSLYICHNIIRRRNKAKMYLNYIFITYNTCLRWLKGCVSWLVSSCNKTPIEFFSPSRNTSWPFSLTCARFTPCTKTLRSRNRNVINKMSNQKKKKV